jgi:ribosome biogenesis GTPase
LLLQQYELAQLGWSDELQAAFAGHNDTGAIPARVAVQHRSEYRLYAESGELRAELAGRVRHEAGWRTAQLPAVGDWVAAEVHGDLAVITGVLPRRTEFVRKAASDSNTTAAQVVAANVDTVFVTAALNIEVGDAFLRRLERYLALAWESGAQPVIVLTKSDLAADVEDAVALVEGIAYGVPVHALSSVTGEGVDAVLGYAAPGRTVALLGSSGVGKSTLINRLAGRELLATREIRADGVGRHTTTHRELVVLPGGGLLLDTPGMRELQLWDAESGAGATFADVEELAAECRFNDCSHETEPGCAVRAAIAGGTLPADRFHSYRKLQRELRALEIRQSARLQSEVTKEYRRRARANRRDFGW